MRTATPDGRACSLARAPVCALTLACAAALACTALAGTPGSLTPIGALDTPASQAVASWNRLALVGTARGLTVQSFEDPAQPLTLAELRLDEAVTAIAVHGDSALLALAGGQRRIVDVSAPPLVSSPVSDSFAFPNLWVGGVPHLAAFEAGEVRVYELSGDGRELRGALAVAGEARGFAVDGGRAYVLAHPEGVVAVSLADPAAPARIGLYPPGTQGGWPYPTYTEEFLQLRAQNGWVYVVLTWPGALRHLRAVDFRDAGAPAARGMISTGVAPYPTIFEVAGRWALLADGGFALRVVDLADPGLLRAQHDVLINDAGLRALHLLGDLILAATTEASRLLGIRAQPGGEPDDWGYTYLYLNADAVAAGPRAAYLVDLNGADELLAVDLADPAAPQPTSRLPLSAPFYGGGAVAPAVVGTALCLVQPGWGIGLFDLTNPLGPVPYGRWQPATPFTEAHIVGNRLAAAQSSGATFYDLSNPFAPQQIARRPAGRGAGWAWCRGSLALAALTGLPDPGYAYDGTDTLVVLDIGGAAPVELGRVPWGADMNRGFVRGHRVYLRDMAAGPTRLDRRDAVVNIADTSQPLVESGPAVRPRLWADDHQLMAELQGHHAVAHGETVSVYHARDGAAPATLLAAWTAGTPVRALAAEDDRLFVHTSGRLTLLAFKADAVPPQLQLELRPDAADPGRLLAVLGADEPLRMKDVFLLANGDTLAIEEAMGGGYQAEIPAAVAGALTVEAHAADHSGNAASATLACAAVRLGAAGGCLRHAGLGLRLEVPAGALALPTWLLLREDGGGGVRRDRAADDHIAFILEPAGLAPARAATLVLPAGDGTLPVLWQLEGADWRELELKLDRAAAAARASLARFGTFRWLADAGQPPVARAVLRPASPNPFNALTNLALELSAPGQVRLRVFDARGRLQRVLNDGWLPAGRHGFDWDGRDGDGRALASGVYFVRLEQGDLQLTGRCALVK